MIVDPPTRSPGIPEGAIITGEIVVTSYMTPDDGTMMYCTNLAGQINLAQAIGLCELAKVSLYEHYKAGEEDD